jgi:hypothetical protein
MEPIWKKEAILYNNFFKLLEEKKKLLINKIKDVRTEITLNDTIEQIISSILKFEYSNVNLEDKYLYNAAKYHSEQYNFESNDNLVEEIRKVHSLLTRFNNLIKVETEQLKSSENQDFSSNYSSQLEHIKILEDDKILTFARWHLEDSFAKVRHFWTTVIQRIRPSKFNTREILKETNTYKIIKEIANEPIGKFYRYTLYRGGVAKAYITGYAWPSKSFYISLVVNPYNNNSFLTKMLGTNKSSDANDHNAFYDLIEVYQYLEQDARNMGLKHLTTLCIPILTEFVQKKFNYKQTGWKEKAFGTPFQYLVKRL